MANSFMSTLDLHISLRKTIVARLKKIPCASIIERQSENDYILIRHPSNAAEQIKTIAESLNLSFSQWHAHAHHEEEPDRTTIHLGYFWGY